MELDKYMGCRIISRELWEGSGVQGQLSMFYDYGNDAEDTFQRMAVMFLVPNTRESGHAHIEFKDEEIQRLRDWCSEYLKMKGVEE